MKEFYFEEFYKELITDLFNAGLLAGFTHNGRFYTIMYDFGSEYLQ